MQFWSAQEATRRIWFSLYTPQVGEASAECLSAEDRLRVAAEIDALRARYPKLEASKRMLGSLVAPPASPQDCVFARTTYCLSADLQTVVMPCQLGGTPDCSSCGCLAAAVLTAVGRYRLPGGIPVYRMLDWSEAIGRRVARVRSLGKVKPHPPRTIPARAVSD